MNEQMNELVRFCKADVPSGRFFEIGMHTDPEGNVDWGVSVFLGQGYTADGPKVVGVDRWLENHAGSLNQALDVMIKRLPTVRKLARHSKKATT